jgi:hypothetical protein
MTRKIDEVIKEFVGIRDRLDAKRKIFKAEEKADKEELEKLSMWLRDKADELGTNSFKTDYGTAYKSTKTYARVGSWDKVLDFIKSTDNWHMLEKRISKINTMEVIDTLGIEPSSIGVDLGADVDMLVRRPDK